MMPHLSHTGTQAQRIIAGALALAGYGALAGFAGRFFAMEQKSAVLGHVVAVLVVAGSALWTKMMIALWAEIRNPPSPVPIRRSGVTP